MSYLHEILVAMFWHRPALAAELLSGPLGLAVPDHDVARPGSTEVVELCPAAHRADSVVLLGDPAVLAVIVEVQLRPDDQALGVAGISGRGAAALPRSGGVAGGVH